MDDIGLHSVMAVEKIYADASDDVTDLPPDFLIRIVEEGLLGAPSGSGFYEHPDPAYARPGFLDGEDET